MSGSEALRASYTTDAVRLGGTCIYAIAGLTFLTDGNGEILIYCATLTKRLIKYSRKSSLYVVLIYFFTVFSKNNTKIAHNFNVCSLCAESNLIDGDFILELIVKPDLSLRMLWSRLWQLLVDFIYLQKLTI